MLDRIVLDECHLYLTSTNDFRPEMMNVSNFVQSYGVQLVMLTATLPKQCQSDLLEKLNIDKVPITVLRDSTSRKNIRYEVTCIGNQPLLSPVQSILDEPRFQNERIIIYVQSLADGETLSNELQLPFYHAHAPEKKSILDQWLVTTKNRVIIATSAMGCGIDIPDIRLVLHAGSPCSIIDFVQQSGRAGRDGNVSYSVMIHRKFEQKQKRMELLMNDYLNGHGNCRRIILESAMDGIDRTKCTTMECQCDCCCRQIQAASSIVSPVPTMILDSNTTSSFHDDHNDDDNGMVLDIDNDENIDPGSFSIDSVTRNEIATPNIGILTPHAVPFSTITNIYTNSTDTNTMSDNNNNNNGNGLEMQRKRLFLDQGLMEEQRKRCNFQEAQRKDFLDFNVFEHWLSVIPATIADGCFICRIQNITGPCANRQQHNKKRYEIERERKKLGDKVNPCGVAFAGNKVPPYCCCVKPGCYVPQMLCASWKSNGKGGFQLVKGAVCNHRDKMLDVICAFKDTNEEAADYAMEKSNGDLTNLLTTQINWGGRKVAFAASGLH